MTDCVRRLAPAACLLVLVVGGPRAAAAQETVAAGQTQSAAVRVVRDRATIWSRNPSLVLAVVEAGTVLRAVSRDNQWIEVVVPREAGGRGGTGFVFSGHVEMVPGSPELPVRQARGTGSKWDERATPASTRAPRAFRARGFGSFSYQTFLAQDSFEAILGEASQPFFGGGGQVVLWERLFVSGGVEWFEKTGERVLVLDGEVYPLGIDDTITMMPITVTAGYRFMGPGPIVPYAGGGFGSLRFKEVSEFAAADENVDERYTSYHAVGGVEFAATKWLFAAIEVQYTSVPDALGAPGVAAEFGETNLGGVSVGVKVLVGL